MERVEINEINFPGENFRNFITEQFDKKGNGFLTQEEINSVAKMDCSNQEIF